ncbi:hypothetical protein Godav_004720 [Gossypium davidsonii]|uniref:Uncharacterized protein n=1 Tax=Gossypium davidsonii TaxID=34287 RepID=A0A7J8SMV2_GOSDV|nr:hypothetical protein [Gossypium davidsonii]
MIELLKLLDKYPTSELNFL